MFLRHFVKNTFTYPRQKVGLKFRRILSNRINLNKSLSESYVLFDINKKRGEFFDSVHFQQNTFLKKCYWAPLKYSLYFIFKRCNIWCYLKICKKIFLPLLMNTAVLTNLYKVPLCLQFRSLYLTIFKSNYFIFLPHLNLLCFVCNSVLDLIHLFFLL